MVGTSFALGTLGHDLPLLAAMGGSWPLDRNSWTLGSKTKRSPILHLVQINFAAIRWRWSLKSRPYTRPMRTPPSLWPTQAARVRSRGPDALPTTTLPSQPFVPECGRVRWRYLVNPDRPEVVFPTINGEAFIVHRTGFLLQDCAAGQVRVREFGKARLAPVGRKSGLTSLMAENLQRLFGLSDGGDGPALNREGEPARRLPAVAALNPELPVNPAAPLTEPWDFAVARITEGNEPDYVSRFGFIARGRGNWSAGSALALSSNCFTLHATTLAQPLAHWQVAGIRYSITTSHSTKAVVAEWQTHQT
jgi:hypothetical protein